MGKRIIFGTPLSPGMFNKSNRAITINHQIHVNILALSSGYQYTTWTKQKDFFLQILWNYGVLRKRMMKMLRKEDSS